MTQFKVGDRVAFYSGRNRIVTEVSEIDNGILLLKDHDRPDSKWIANPHQCRKLVKRERREWWVYVYDDGSIEECEQKSSSERKRLYSVKVREVRKVRE